MARKYSIAFDTRDTPGKIKAVTVELSLTNMGKNDVARVDLCDHHLYHHLERYVLAHPTRPRPSTAMRDGEQGEQGPM